MKFREKRSKRKKTSLKNKQQMKFETCQNNQQTSGPSV